MNIFVGEIGGFFMVSLIVALLLIFLHEIGLEFSIKKVTKQIGLIAGLGLGQLFALGICCFTMYNENNPLEFEKIFGVTLPIYLGLIASIIFFVLLIWVLEYYMDEKSALSLGAFFSVAPYTFMMYAPTNGGFVFTVIGVIILLVLNILFFKKKKSKAKRCIPQWITSIAIAVFAAINMGIYIAK